MKATALNTAVLKKQLIFLLVILPLMITACATGAKSELLAPEWFKALEESEDGEKFLVKISTFSMDEAETADRAVNELYDRIMEISEKSDIYSEPADQERLKSQLRTLIESEEAVDGIVSLYRQEWVFDDESSYYYGAFNIYKSAAEKLNDRLMDTYYNYDPVLNDFINSAEANESEGKFYSAAEELLKAALYVHQQSGPLSAEITQMYIDRAGVLLSRITVTGVQAPDRTYANTQIADPFHLLCSSEDAFVSNVEFLVQYEGKNRAGEKGQFERRLVSNSIGIVEFYHPFLPFSGTAQVSFTPGSREFISTAQILSGDGLDMSAVNNWVAGASVNYEIAVESASRKLAMGIVLLHTDITGAPLNIDESSLGLAEALSQDGYEVKVMALDPGEIGREEEAAFLRDLKALYKEDYVRVVFGAVGIQDFESRGDSFRVKTGGTIKIADVQSGEIIMNLSLDKSVETRNNNLAVTASFRELGRAFAQEIISGLE